MPQLKEILTTVKTYYPDNHVLWLREAADYFNTTLASEDALDLSNPFSELPLSLITKVHDRRFYSRLNTYYLDLVDLINH